MNEATIIKIGDLEIKKIEINNTDYLCISDFASKENSVSSGVTIMNWLRSRETIAFLGLWEKINNTNFNVIEFDYIKNQSGLNAFSISTKKWVEKTNAIGISSKAGRYGGTYAHIDIAMEFASWLSPEFKLYLITEFQKLKKEEAQRNNEIADWNNHRWLSKANFKLHTDAIKDNIVIPNKIQKSLQYKVYSSEADMLNVIVFGIKAVDFKNQCPEFSQGNLRDVASKKALNIVSNLESANARMIREGLTQKQRFDKLTTQAFEEKRSFGILYKGQLYKISESPLLYQDLAKIPFFKKMENSLKELEG